MKQITKELTVTFFSAVLQRKIVNFIRTLAEIVRTYIIPFINRKIV